MKTGTIGEGISRLIKKIGCTVSVYQGDGRTWQAIIQPLHYRNKIYVEESSERTGMINRTAYLYIGMPENDLSKYPRGTVFVCGDEMLTLMHSEINRLNDKSEYEWAVLGYYGDVPQEAEEESGGETP